MSMVIGKEAREALEALDRMSERLDALDAMHDWSADKWLVRDALYRCTDAPEAGIAEPVGFISHTREGDAWGVNRQFDAPRVTLLYAHPPEVGLPEGFEIREDPNEYVFVVQAPGRPGYAVWRDKEPAVYALLEAIKPLWLESAGQKEQSNG